VTQEEYRVHVMLCREEIRNAKAQPELRLATVVRDNKKCFYKYIHKKKRAKENLHPLLDARGNIVNKDEKKLRYLMLSSPQSLTFRLVIRRIVSPQ